METKVFDDLNVFEVDEENPDLPPLDLDLNYVPEPKPRGCLPFLFSKLRPSRPPSSRSSATTTTASTATGATANPANNAAAAAPLNSQASNPER